MASGREEQAQRGHFFAIVDEVDSILVDEARTPLIISGRADDAQQLYYQFARIVKDLQRDRDYEVDEAKKTVVPTEEGIGRVEEPLSVIEPLRARQPELRPPAPGRAAGQGAVQARRRLRGGRRRGEDRRRVHRPHPRRPALERRSAPGGRGQGGRARQGGEPDLATVTLQNYFRMYEKLSGMTGTAATEAGRVRAHVRARGRLDPHQPADGPCRRARPHLQDRRGQVRRGRRRHPGALRDRAAGARRHDLGREVRAPGRPAQAPGSPARGAQREAARARGERRHPGRAARTV